MSYEKILTESSLMVTDYSGVQFDFAYMRKPILYYHPTELPPHYEESCFIYDTMGFGPIIDNQDKLVKSLCEYMDNGCKMEQKYIDRANDFFEYSDFDNCKRILENVEKYTEEKK
jgi:CDP-glycerol glycerophosphotransferase (TagB/SpsB family)